MFLCRTGRLSAAALDQAFKSSGSFLVQVQANRLRDVTLTLRKGHTLHRCFCVSVRGVNPTLVHVKKTQQQQQQQQQQTVGSWDPSSGVVVTDWAQLDRVAAIASNLFKSVHSEGGHSGIIRPVNRRHSSIGEPRGHVLFTGSILRGVPSSHRCCTGTMQTRSTSTSTSDKAKSKKSDSQEQTADTHKGEEQNLKDALTISSTAGKDPGEAEPEEGKPPSKTQQLKKVFKEYGAVGVSFHVCISIMSLGMFYLLISSGMDMAGLLCKLGFSESVVQSRMAAGTSTFVLSYAVHKLFAPVRMSMTLVSVPLIVRYFRKTGLFKPPTPAP